MKRLLAAALCMVCTSAIANPDKIASDSASCWALPAAATIEKPEYESKLSVTFGDDGNVSSVSTVSVEPDNELNQSIADSFATAIERCNVRTSYRGDYSVFVPSISSMFR